MGRANSAQPVGAGLLLVGYTGCQAPPDSFAPVSAQGHSIADLFGVAMLLSLLVLVLVVGLLAYILLRYRERPEDGAPSQTEGNRNLEIAWTVAPTLLLVVLFVLTVRTMNAVDDPPAATPASPLRIRVIGRQWWWEYRYPDLGVITANELHVPVGKPTRLEIEAADVVHSFWVPRFGWKVDAIPGKTNTMSVTLGDAGVYDGTCAEFCGTQHAWMRIRAIADPPDRFDEWIRQQRRPAAQPQEATVRAGEEVFLRHTCESCHAIDGTSAKGRVGPDLTHLGSRSTLGAGVVSNTPENLRDWVRDAKATKPGVLMPSFNLSNAELQSLVSYLEGLK
jgi:cytochrome c oxidase subunit 2